MAKVIIVLRLREKRNFSVLHSFCDTIRKGFVTKAATYPDPKPDMPTFKSRIDAMEKLIVGWGTRENRGAHSTYTALVRAANELKNDLRRLRTYAQYITPEDEINFSALGFETHTHGHRTPNGELPAPTNLRVERRGPYISGQIRYRWTPVRGARGYKIYSGTGHPPTIPPDDSLVFTTVPNTEFIQTGHPSGTKLWIIVGCIGTNGTTGYVSLEGQTMP